MCTSHTVSCKLIDNTMKRQLVECVDAWAFFVVISHRLKEDTELVS